MREKMKIAYVDRPLPKEIEAISPLFAKALEEMARLKNENAPDGSYPVSGEELFINVMSYETKPRNGGMFEAHRLYADIPMMIEGEVEIGFSTLPDSLKIREPYKYDYELYDMTDPYVSERIGGDRLCIILPDEPHAPGIAPDGCPRTVRKMVAKVRCK